MEFERCAMLPNSRSESRLPGQVAAFLVSAHSRRLRRRRTGPIAICGWITVYQILKSFVLYWVNSTQIIHSCLCNLYCKNWLEFVSAKFGWINYIDYICGKDHIMNNFDFIMKKAIDFILGLIVGVILTLGVLFVLGRKFNSSKGGESPSVTMNKGMSLYKDPGVSLFDEPGAEMSLRSFKVFQVMSNGTALAQSSEKSKVEYSFQFSDPVVFFLPEDGASYYDDQIIKCPAGKVVRQIGTYRYETKNDFVKTVPIVKFIDK